MKKELLSGPRLRVLGRHLAVELSLESLRKASAGGPTCSTTNGATSSGCCGDGDDNRLDCPSDPIPR
jgi:hypothetical protein